MRTTLLAAAVAGAVLATASAATASDRTVKLAVATYERPIANAVTAASKCTGTGAAARRCRVAAGTRLVAVTTTASTAATRAAASGASTCVRNGLDTYQTGLKQWAAVGRALQRGQLARVNTVTPIATRTLKRGQDAVLDCAAPPPPTTTG
ncbi:MAG: hypothetical protein MUE51_09375 [Thermoleophilia bacterium]|jgi:hypothetical protein|nr:hypothetical protein [Thermoleophilia bacterium]